MVCKVGTIRQIHQRLVREGYQVSECALRRWIKEGILPAVYSGSKALISYHNVLEILTGPPSAALAATTN